MMLYQYYRLLGNIGSFPDNCPPSRTMLIKMDASTLVYECLTWDGNFRKFFKKLSDEDRVVENPNVRPGDDPDLNINTTTFSGLDGGERQEIYRRIDDGMELLATVKSEKPYCRVDQVEDVKYGVNTLLRKVAFLAVNVFVNTGRMTEEQFIENQARFKSFMEAWNGIIEVTPEFYQPADTRQAARTYGKG